MKRVTGIGGIFFNAKDPVALRAWYKKHLGRHMAVAQSGFQGAPRVCGFVTAPRCPLACLR